VHPDGTVARTARSYNRDAPVQERAPRATATIGRTVHPDVTVAHMARPNE
jgi:hypothetical protein